MADVEVHEFQILSDSEVNDAVLAALDKVGASKETLAHTRRNLNVLRIIYRAGYRAGYQGGVKVKTTVSPATALALAGGERIVRPREMAARLGVSSSRLSEWLADPAKYGKVMPRPRQVGPRAVGWLLSEVEASIRSLPRKKPHEDSRSKVEQ